MVPADAFLLEAKDLHVNEAALTGESLPVEKERTATPHFCEPRRGRRAVRPHGSSVVSGNAIAAVTARVPRTAFGEIAQGLARRPPPSEFEHGIARFGVLILKTVLFLVLFVFVVPLRSIGAPLRRCSSRSRSRSD